MIAKIWGRHRVDGDVNKLRAQVGKPVGFHPFDVEPLRPLGQINVQQNHRAAVFTRGHHRSRSHHKPGVGGTKLSPTVGSFAVATRHFFAGSRGRNRRAQEDLCPRLKPIRTHQNLGLHPRVCRLAIVGHQEGPVRGLNQHKLRHQSLHRKAVRRRLRVARLVGDFGRDQITSVCKGDGRKNVGRLSRSHDQLEREVLCLGGLGCGIDRQRHGRRDVDASNLEGKIQINKLQVGIHVVVAGHQR